MTTLLAAPNVPLLETASLCVYIPSHNNSQEVCESVASCPADLPIVISDNYSTDEHHHALEALQNRCSLIFHDKDKGRIENWAFCLRHFAAQSASGGPLWMKLLFAGDTLNRDAQSFFEQGVKNYPAARLVIAEHDMAEGNARKPWRTLERTQLVEPERSLFLAASIGNWFGPPLAYFIHRDAIQCGFDFGDLPWSADFLFCLGIATSFPVLYLAQNVGTFQTLHRNYYKAYANSSRMVLGDSVVRVEAARRYKELTSDAPGFDALIEQIEEFSGRESLRCALSQPNTLPIAEAAVRSLGLRRFLRVVISEGMERLRQGRLLEKI